MLNNVKTMFHKKKSITLPGIPASFSSRFFKADITSDVTAFVSSEKIRRMLFTFRVQGLLWNYGTVCNAWYFCLFY
jgi:hypothetical protein